MRREIVEEQSFLDQMAALGNFQRIDERLNGLKWALWLDAEDFPLINESKTIRVAKILGYGDVPDLIVFFNIDVTEKVVLRWIEPHEAEAPPEQ